MGGVAIDLDVVREMRVQGYSLKQIAFALGVGYNRLAERTAAAGIRFRNNPHKGLRPKSPPQPRVRNRKAEQAEVPPPTERDHTRRFLDLCEAWEREMRADLKAELWQQVEAMRA